MAKKAKLNPRQRRFVEEYLIDLNASQAVIRAGYQGKNPNVVGPRMLANVRIAEAVASAMAARSERTQIKADAVLREFARVGFVDIRRLMKWTEDRVEFVPSEELSEDDAAAVAAVESETTTTTRGRGEEREVEKTIKLKLKLNDKLNALTQMGRHLSLFTDKQELTGKDGEPVFPVDFVRRVLGECDARAKR